MRRPSPEDRCRTWCSGSIIIIIGGERHAVAAETVEDVDQRILDYRTDGLGVVE
jgi:hypothetical protein